MVESGKITRSTEECEISRSCHSATFSSAACVLARTTRASPLICSQVTGLRLCGIAVAPFRVSLKYPSDSRTPVRSTRRISLGQMVLSQIHQRLNQRFFECQSAHGLHDIQAF